jgi:dihydroorotate dehydrogenase electron transfer subunit
LHRYFKAKITGNNNLNKNFILLSATPYIETIAPTPGQFYMLQAGRGYDPLLKRPFSLFSHEDNVLQFLCRICGKGTTALSRLREGDDIKIIGPLGKGYPKPPDDFIVVAGGIGIASLLPLIQRHKGRAYLFYGARNKEELVMSGEAKASSKEAFITTDNGSEGQKGMITDLLKDSLLAARYSLPVYACGPSPMLKALSNIVKERGLKCYASLEEHMACGVGACLGCVVKTTWGYKRVCKEGPVFDMKDIIWE